MARIEIQNTFKSATPSVIWSFSERRFVSAADISHLISLPGANAQREFGSIDSVIDTDIASDLSAEREFNSTGDLVSSITSDIELPVTGQWYSFFQIVIVINTNWEIDPVDPLGQWANPYFNVNGSFGGEYWLKIHPIGAWEIGLRPVKVRVTGRFENETGFDFWLRDTADNIIAYNSNYTTDGVAEETIDWSNGLDIDGLELQHPASGNQIKNIEFWLAD